LPLAARCRVLVVLALCGCREPELTQQRILDDLGDDELALTSWTDPEDSTEPCESKAGFVSVDEERDAAVAAGWIERVCKDVPGHAGTVTDRRPTPAPVSIASGFSKRRRRA
jgi:hypothetical protein